MGAEQARMFSTFCFCIRGRNHQDSRDGSTALTTHVEAIFKDPNVNTGLSFRFDLSMIPLRFDGTGRSANCGSLKGQKRGISVGFL